MRSLLLNRHVQTIFAVALLHLCNISLTNGEEIVFYGDDGSIFTITITGGCYNFNSKWEKKAVAGDIDQGCFEVWDQINCLGDTRKLTSGLEALRDLKKINFDKKISSVSLCSEPVQPAVQTPAPIRETTSSETNSSNKRPTSNKSRTLSGMSLQQVRDAAVAEHNKYRARHGAQALEGDATMNAEAQKYAESLAAANKFELNRNARWIGNIASSFRRNPEDAVKDAIARWYDGVNYYDFNNPGFSREAGSFTAIVWKSSSKMGIGAAWNQFENHWVIISYYAPSPNLQGAFKENVQPEGQRPDYFDDRYLASL